MTCSNCSQCARCGEDNEENFYELQLEWFALLKRFEDARKIIKRYNENVEYYKEELAGSWIDIHNDAMDLLKKGLK